MGNTQHIIDTKKTTLADRMAFSQTPRGPKVTSAGRARLLHHQGLEEQECRLGVHQVGDGQDSAVERGNKGHLARARRAGQRDVRQKFTWHGSIWPPFTWR
jgi:hypothetical protein